MFTGLIESVGRIRTVDGGAAGLRLGIETTLSPELGPGDSLAVNGVCLTVTAVSGTGVRADVGPETARITTLGAARPDQMVSLERSLRADGRLGGHFVQGHVDGMGAVAGVREEGEAHWITVAFPAPLAPLLIRKGSVAVDGISLTVADLRDGQFDVMIVPFTWDCTHLASLGVGDAVNLECDMIGKYVERILAVRGESLASHRDGRGASRARRDD
jgi:riboflavin synthase